MLMFMSQGTLFEARLGLGFRAEKEVPVRSLRPQINPPQELERF